VSSEDSALYDVKILSFRLFIPYFILITVMKIYVFGMLFYIDIIMGFTIQVHLLFVDIPILSVTVTHTKS
jgi:hypothetical protein